MNDMQTKPARRAAMLLRALVLAGLALGSGAGLAQALNDIPMAVKNNTPPNFMFMIDNSGSMLNIVPGPPYDPAATYMGACPAAGGGIVIPAANSTIEIRVVGGEPFARLAGTNRRHVSVTNTGNRICFTNTDNYIARLYNPVGGYGQSSYTGHYLNWYFGNYDGHPMTGWTTRKPVNTGSVTTRMDVAKNSATTVIGTLPITTPASVRLGLSTFNNGNGGTLRMGMSDLTAANRATLNTSISGLNAGGTTPLAETLADIGRYMATGYSGNITADGVTGVSINDFLAQNGRGSCLNGANCLTTTTDADAAPTTGTPTRPIQYWCQRSYAFVMTDGLSNGDQAFSNNTRLRDYDRDCQGALAANCVNNGNPANWDRKIGRFYEAEGSDYLDDVAKALFDMDLRPNLPSPDPVLRPKKNNLSTYTIGFADRGLVNDPLLVNTARQAGGKALFPADASELTSAFTSVITDAFAKDAAAAAVAVANAQITLGNTGYASSYRSGSWYGDLVAYSLNTSTALQTGGDLWSLRVNLDSQAPASRKIATFNGSNGVEFASGLTYAGKPASLTNEVIQYLRGDRSKEIDAAITDPARTFRARQHVLGDIINAEPVVVTYPGNVPIIFQGGNGGMLHVVDGRVEASVPTRGQELWAYVPKLVHDNLADLTKPDYLHKYYIDGTPAVAELSTTSKILVGGLGKGGRGYFALDISDYNAATQADAASKVLWEFSPTGMGYSFGTPLIVKVGTDWRVIVASGYDATVHGIWVLDPATGTGPFISAPSASGLAHLGKLANTAADANTRFVWGGDNVGNVFRFDLVAQTAVRIAVLTDAGGTLAQPVTSPPEVGPVPGSTTKFLVHIGTGRYLADADVPGPGQNPEAVQRQTIYGLLDDTSVASPALPNLRGTNGNNCVNGGNGDLVCQTLTYVATSGRYQASTNAVDLSTKRGWYLDLPTDSTPAANNMINGRVVSKPALTTGGTLTLTVNIPTNVQCDPGGRSWFLALNSVTGGAVPRDIGGNTYFESGFFLGYALGSRPVIVLTADGKRALIRMSDKDVKNPDVPESATAAAQWRRIYFRPVK